MARRQPARQSVRKYRTSQEQKMRTSNVGFTGIKIRGGRVDEEFLPELRGAKGMKVIREMESNDPIVGAVMFAISMLIRQCEWEVKPFSDQNVHMKQAEAIRTMLDDMTTTWSDVLSEILSMLPYGWSFLEVTYKNRAGYTHADDPLTSRYKDGVIGWQNMAIRGQDTLVKWIRDPQFRVTGFEQADGEGRKAIMPLNKGLLFRTSTHKDNPEGRSILRNSFRPWYFKKRLEEIEAIGIERDMNGVPVMTTPEGVNIWDASDGEAAEYLRMAETVVRNLRRDEQEGIVKPYGWELELLSAKGSRSVDTTQVIGRYANAIAMTCLADFIILGHNNRYGSKALAGNKTAMFQHSITGWAKSIADVINRIALTKLYAYNAWPMDEMATFRPKGLMLPDLEAMSIFMKNLSQAGFKIFPNIEIEKAILALADLPTEGVQLGRDNVDPNTQLTVDAAREAQESEDDDPAADPADPDTEDQE